MTGAEGFVGRHLQARLAREGVAVVATDREVDVTDVGRVAASVRGAVPDAVVHLAARTSVPEAERDPEGVRRVNVEGTRSVLEAVARHAPDARILIVTSGQIYGPASPDAPPWREQARLRPASIYARSKAEADVLGEQWANRGLAVLRARPFNHTGPGQSDLFVASSFARQLAEIEAGRRAPLLVVGNLDSVRDFLDVDDVAEAYWRLLDPAVPDGPYNVASGRGVRIGTLLERLIERTSVRPDVRVDPSLLRPTDASVGDAARLRETTGWRPQRTLDETLARLLDDWRQRLRATP